MRKLWSDRELQLLLVDSACPVPPTPLEIGINNEQHLARFEQTTPWLTRDAFLALSKKHYQQRDCYIVTAVDAEGPLLGYGLARANTIESRFPEVDQRVRWPAGTGTMFTGFVHPNARGRGIHTVLLVARINLLIRECAMRYAVCAVDADNLAAVHSIAKTMRLVAVLGTRFRLGHALRTASVRDPTFDAQFLDAARAEAGDSHS